MLFLKHVSPLIHDFGGWGILRRQIALKKMTGGTGKVELSVLNYLKIFVMEVGWTLVQ
jgi:hypothetical protein